MAMSSEEVKAREWLKTNYPNICPAEEQIAVKAYTEAFAEGRKEKEPLIKLLDKKIVERKEKIDKLEAQIERMKCCENCKSYFHPSIAKCSECFELSDWELRDAD